MSVVLIRNLKKTTLEAGMLVRLMYNVPPIREELARISKGVIGHISNSPYFSILGTTLNGQKQRLAIDVVIDGVPVASGREDLDFMLSSLKTVSTSIGPFGLVKAEFIGADESTSLSRSLSMGAGTVSRFEGEPLTSQPSDFLSPLDRAVLRTDKAIVAVAGGVGTVAKFFTSPGFIILFLIVAVLGVAISSGALKGKIV